MMRSVLALATALAVGAFGAPSVPVNLTVSDLVRAGNHLDMAQDTVTEWDGSLSAYQPGALPVQLFRVRGVTTSRAVPTTTGEMDIMSRELLLYYSPGSDVLATTFVSPWDAKTYPVIHTQNNPVYTVLPNTTYPGTSSGDVTTVTYSSTSSFLNPLNSDPATQSILGPFSGNMTNITMLDTTTYTFPTSLLPPVGKPQSLPNVTISRTRVTPLLPFMGADAETVAKTTLLFILTGRKVDEGIDGLSQTLQDTMEDKKLWAFEDAPVSRDDAGSRSQKTSINGTDEWKDFGTSNFFNAWRMNNSAAFPVSDIGDWCDA
ncbi:hypothetical protein RhiJN_10975 [Ceratobasidium sp. AG-Ba]|nr:hypothetical protein RhiJN_10975 [Ceratobasidium sp. AG-Ba]QRW11711.1 hypothetical protein RhiLY_10710 [Ceratobasidium sp. AG-Ba]